MLKSFITAVAACLLAQVSAADDPRPPDVSLAEGKAMMSLARTAMETYRTRRTPPSAQPLPKELASLARQTYPVAVTLRRGGKVAARVVQDGASCPRNLISAALLAMRSEELPDKVTKDVLDGLTVEVEVVGPLQPVSAQEASKLCRPGQTGVKVAAGKEFAYLLPSVSYLLGMRAEEMPRMARSLMRLTAENAQLEPRYALFTSRHYVGYPDGKVVWLECGAVPVPDEMIGPQALSGAASATAAYLMRYQDTRGQYHTHDGAGDMLGHLRCTLAMARLGRTRDDAAVSASVNAAIRYAIPSVKTESNKAWVATEDPNDRPAATALLRLAIGQAPRDDKAAAVADKLQAFLDDANAAQLAGLPVKTDAKDAYRRMFKPLEAYFAADPAALVGGVRVRASSARADLDACAEAIQAFLGKSAN